LQKQIESAASLIEETKLDVVAAIDALKIEVETLRVFIERQHPELGRVYPSLKQEIIEKIDPEWPASPRDGSEK
jgi:hypothetical protein